MKRIKKNDMVMVTKGREKGKTGRVLRMVDGGRRVIIEKVNIVKRHTKPSQENQFGGLVDKEAPLAVANVILLDKGGSPIKVGFEVVKREDGKRTKMRVARKTQESID
jgi:large subunit ribosomal protein L24